MPMNAANVTLRKGTAKRSAASALHSTATVGVARKTSHTQRSGKHMTRHLLNSFSSPFILIEDTTSDQFKPVYKEFKGDYSDPANLAWPQLFFFEHCALLSAVSSLPALCCPLRSLSFRKHIA